MPQSLQARKSVLLSIIFENNCLPELNSRDELGGMKNFSEKLDGFILKNRSPSCGIYGIRVFDDIDKPSVKFKDKGLFAKSILHHFSNFPIEEEGRLKNTEIREHFFTAIFAIANFRDEVTKSTR